MTALTEQNDLVVVPEDRRARPTRFLQAYVFGLLAVLVIAAGLVLAFEASYDGRILPGIHVGSVDLSGLTRSQAEGKLVAAYTGLGDGKVTLTAGTRSTTVTYADLGRRLDTDRLLDEAMRSGRDGSPAERVAQHLRTAISGATIAPVTVIDRAAAGTAIEALAVQVDRAAKDASLAVSGDAFQVTPAATGQATDRTAALVALEAGLAPADAAKTLSIDVPVDEIQPDVSTDSAVSAKDAANRIAQDIDLLDGTETWTIPAASIRGWITFGRTGGQAYGPVVAREGLQAALADIAKKVERKPVDAQYLIGKGEAVVGVTQGQPGRSLDVEGTLAAVEDLVAERAKGERVSRVPIVSVAVQPQLSTEEATKTAPLMQAVSEWTTYFPVGISNGYGANIWIPAADLDGQVVLPGGWFDFFKSIGPISRDRGYKDGGAIINGKTEPTGALAGGMCSTSTTLFNAALRAGLQMGARMNHYYYIGRYPLGLDATVFDSGSGSVQTMSFRNDTSSPILIRSYRWADGAKGYVKFVLYTVPIGRRVVLSAPIIKNVVPAVMHYLDTTSLAPGVRQVPQVAIDGKDTWVTRTVYDASGNVVHKETYYSHYAMIPGTTLVGVAPTPPPPAPTAAPTTP